MLCRFCAVEEENLAHILTCEAIRKVIGGEVAVELEKWLENCTEMELDLKLRKILKEEPSLVLCQYTREFESKVKELNSNTH